ncbi:RHS repeat-associated core domain-containing protein [Planctellipticum variicoloris]|uniref:RHS repeat-associated core domain-containing protein n=1 Tax=Planctellipticum variicoloris TaxID=3064265 RepID=UPI003013C86A|nr:YwqJ-related putative deaminase [Planctomycetaceae bacterium SH412]
MIEATGSTGWSELTATDWSNLTTSGWSGLGVSAGEQARVTWSYDPTGQLLAEARSGANAYRTTYVYDPSGNRTVEITETDRTTSVYDGANRLLGSTSFSGNTTYSYDPAGNRTRLETPALELTTYTWNAENQLIQIELPAGDVVTHVWSPVNKNAEERIVEQDDGVIVTRFLWDNNNVVRETDEVGAVEAEYTYQAEPFGDLVSQRRETDSSYYRFDALGSTTGLTDATGAVTDDYRYQAFGEPVETTGATENPYRWVGQVGYRQEEATGLYNLRARDYDPASGRFVSQDPTGLRAGDTNFYRYITNQPVQYTDPTGLGDPNWPPGYWVIEIPSDEPGIPATIDFRPPHTSPSVIQSILKYNPGAKVLQSPNYIPPDKPLPPLPDKEGTTDDALLSNYEIDVLCACHGYEMGRPLTDQERAWLARIDYQIAKSLDDWFTTALLKALAGNSFSTLVLRREELLKAARQDRRNEFQCEHDFFQGSRDQARCDAAATLDFLELIGGLGELGLAGRALRLSSISHVDDMPDTFRLNRPRGSQPICRRDGSSPFDSCPIRSPEPSIDGSQPPAPQSPADRLAERTMTRGEWEEFYRQLRTAARRAGEENDLRPKRFRSPVETGLIDSRTCETFTGLNNTSLPTPLHPFLNDRLKDFFENTDIDLFRCNADELGRWVYSQPGEHAEMQALNEALWARTRAGLPIDLSELWMVNRSSSKSCRQVPRCGYCRDLTHGVNVPTD